MTFINYSDIVRIQARSSCISISLTHSNPALIGEYYDVTLSVVNEEDTAITDLDIKISLPESLDEAQPYGECTLNMEDMNPYICTSLNCDYIILVFWQSDTHLLTLFCSGDLCFHSFLTSFLPTHVPLREAVSGAYLSKIRKKWGDIFKQLLSLFPRHWLQENRYHS